MTDATRISILLPVRDAAATLPACLDSVRRQTESRWRCVIVDDGSSDDTPAIAEAYRRRDPRFEAYRTERLGLVSALHTGLAHCRDGYVARMDADDLMHSKRLADQVALLKAHPELAAAGCHVRLFPREDLAEGSRAYEAWINSIDSPEAVAREAFVECPVAHPCLMVRREILLEAGYRDRGWPEDYDLVLRLLAAGRRIGVVPRRRLMWRRHGNQLSRRSPAYSIERFAACKAAFLASGFLRQDARYILWGHGGTGRILKRALAAHDKRPAQIVEVHPGRLGNFIDGVEVVPPERLRNLPRRPLIVSVAGAGPRTEIRAKLGEIGFREGSDYVCAA